MVIDLDGGGSRPWDRGEGTPLLFIHGVGTSGALWQGDLIDPAACRPALQHPAGRVPLRAIAIARATIAYVRSAHPEKALLTSSASRSPGW